MPDQPATEPISSRPVASSTYLAKHDGDDDAWITHERLPFPGVTCSDGFLLDVCGLLATAENGRTEFNLGSFVCASRRDFNSYKEPVNITTSPHATSPFLTTVTHKLIPYDDGSTLNQDVAITVYSWNPDGSPAPNVFFYWRCRVPAESAIF